MEEKMSLKLNKDSTALIIMDMQNAFVKTEGSLSKMGIPVARASDPIENIKKIKKSFKENDMPIIYIQMTLRKDLVDAGVLLKVFPPLKALGHCEINTWDYEIIEELTPESGDYIVQKFRFDSFYGTNLETLLRCLNIDTLVFSGIATNVCVESTVRAALTRDFSNIVVKDATASFTEEMENAAFINFEFGFAKLVNLEDLEF